VRPILWRNNFRNVVCDNNAYGNLRRIEISKILCISVKSRNGEISAFSEIGNLLADVVLVIAPDESNDPLTAESEIEIRVQIKHRGRSTSFDPPSSPLP
jgi:hypothetical protein